MFPIRMLTVAALAAALTTVLPAQTAAQPSANRFIPENSAFVLRIASPAKWRKQFGATQVAKLAQANSLAPYLGMAAEQIEQGMEMLRENGVFDADLASGLLNTWQGDIVISAQVDWDKMMDAMQYGENPPISLVVALTPDGSFDLAPVAKEFEQMIEKTAPSGLVMRDLVVGDMTLRSTDHGGNDMDGALPTMIDGHLVMIAGFQLEKDAAKLLSSEARFTGTSDAPFFMQADFGRAMDIIFEMGMQGAPFDADAMLEAIGLKAMTTISMSLRPSGQAVAGEFHIGLKKEGRGLMNMFAKGQQAPKLLSSIPANSEAFSVTAMEFGGLYKSIQDIWGTVEEMMPMTFDDAIGALTEATKVRLKEDLLDNLGKEMLVVQDVEALRNMDLDDSEDNPAAMFQGSVYGIALRDGDAFGAALDKMLRSRGMHVGRKTEQYANAEVNRMKIAGLVEVEYVVAKDLLLIGIGGSEGTTRALRNILDTRAAGEAKGPAILAKRAADFAPGWNSIGISPVAAVLEGVVTGLQKSGQFGEELDMAAQIVKGVVADMNRIGLGSMVTAAYCDDSGITSSFRW